VPDRRFTTHSARARTCVIDAGDVATTDFALSQAHQETLVAGGRLAATQFLDTFNAASYVNVFGNSLPDVEPSIPVPA